MSETDSHPTALLVASDLKKNFGNLQAVAGLDLVGHAGDVIGVLGPNGAGKTTTLRMLAGTLAPSSGEIELCGFSMKHASRQAKNNMGYLPETPPLYEELSVLEQLNLAAALRHSSSKARQDKVEQVMSECGLQSESQRLIRFLSKGFRQRVALAQALVGDPKVLILDEPTAGLDLAQLVQMRALIKKLSGERLILLSTHILQEVVQNCNRVVMLSRGVKKLDESLATLQQRHTDQSLETVVSQELALHMGT
ncbi:MAG: multidrug ABC transporter ATP-binding protein [Myxococcales bacterium]|nr:multidrug ABC transporter ATP-binding protein [Myxococcales bacterium]|tara:strand:- start:103 stop:858 length:756 start_codon:yes stop_codon:yes gene_type:complete